MRNLEAVEYTAGLIYSHFVPVLCKFFITFLSFPLAPTTSEQWSETLATCVKTKYKSSIANPSDIPFCCSPFPYALTTWNTDRSDIHCREHSLDSCSGHTASLRGQANVSPAFGRLGSLGLKWPYNPASTPGRSSWLTERVSDWNWAAKNLSSDFANQSQGKYVLPSFQLFVATD